jgi:GH25 family lysozyme M1 (1,4-beta-N-acetylmuramidase)
MKIADVSVYQGTIDWTQAVKELDFVILRASVGLNVDKKYKANAAKLDELKCPYHAYHFIKALTVAEAKNEAAVFASATNTTNPLFYVIDAEYNQIKSSFAKTVIEAFEAELRKIKGNDIRVAVYIGHHLYKSWKLDYNKYAYVWIPRYGTNSGQPETKPSYPCDLWQYTSNGKVVGIKSRTDLSILMGTKPLDYFTNPDGYVKSEEPKPEFKPVTPVMKPTLRKGDSGGEVKDLQKKLISLGYDLGKYGADGRFGDKTEAAVKKFQKKNELVIDGIVGKRTWAKLLG